MSITDLTGRPATPVVLEFADIALKGNIIPRAWYRSPLLKYKSGKTYNTAITLLSDIVYWYRPIRVEDPDTHKLIGYFRKFRDHRLEVNYDAWGAIFGFSGREARDAVTHLVNVELIEREIWRPSNRVFLEPYPDAIKALSAISVLPETEEEIVGNSDNGGRGTSEREPGHVETEAQVRSDGGRGTLKRNISNNTRGEITENTSSEREYDDENIKSDLVQGLIELRVSPTEAKKLAQNYPEEVAARIKWWKARNNSNIQKLGAAVRSSIVTPDKWPMESPGNGQSGITALMIEERATYIAQKEYERLIGTRKAIVDQALSEGKSLVDEMGRECGQNIRQVAHLLLRRERGSE